jgi:hypothetical protein
MSIPNKWQVFWFIVIVFIIYAVLHDPSDSAGTTETVWNHIKDGLSAVGTFFDELLD